MSTAYIIFSSVIVKIAFRKKKKKTFTHICTMWGNIKITVPPSDDLPLSGRWVFFMLVCVFANALADPSFRDVYISECDIWLNQDWSDTRKMSGEQPELGKCHRVKAARSAAVPLTWMDTHITRALCSVRTQTVHTHRQAGRSMTEVSLLLFLSVLYT